MRTACRASTSICARRARACRSGETAFTPPVSLVLALEEALDMIHEEGLSAVHARHRGLSLAMRAGAQALGFTPFAAHPSHAVTSLRPPPGIAPSAVVKRLRETHGMVVGGGQDQLKDSIFRVGHMGAYDLADIQVLLAALEECVHALGGPKGTGSATTQARAAWDAA